MHREDDSRFLLFIEPKASEKLSEQLVDEWTALMIVAMGDAEKGVSNYNKIDELPRFHNKAGYKGFHRTDCGELSTCYDLQLKNGMITNSLALFYLQWYRNSIPETEWIKLRALNEFYDKHGDEFCRVPCEYCGEKHLNYACDMQIEYIKTNILKRK